MAPTLLSNDQVSDQIKELHGWTLDGKEIRKLVELTDFVHAMGFVNSVALLAEKHNHHPDIDIRWNKVRLTLSTHSAGGLTEYDFKLAKAIDGL
ncbi:MAG: 4a-hydroxytetrahydrobiopterin dehydratase [Ignavibacteriales bacterium]|nr:4a-hydroxytetrahydrobiopterin dehydratase [Ignavibacteriales bacterium]